MKPVYSLLFLIPILLSCQPESDSTKRKNPFLTNLNDPIDYANVAAEDLDEYARVSVENAVNKIAEIKSIEAPTFENTFVALDDMYHELGKASDNCFTMYWVSPDSLTRVRGLADYQLIDSLINEIGSDRQLFDKIDQYRNSEEYGTLEGYRKRFVDDLVVYFEQSGVNFEPEKLERFKQLTNEITDLSSQYSINMNSADRVLVITEEESEGLPDNFKKSYLNDDGQYHIPVIPATRNQVIENAIMESTRKTYLVEYYNRGMDENMKILDQLIAKRYEIGQLMGPGSYADYNLKPKMAKTPENVWTFINDLITQTKPKAIEDHEKLMLFRNENINNQGNQPVEPWNVAFYKNQLLKTTFEVDHEKIREYLPMESCLSGMMDIYQQVLGYEFRKVENPSVWHEEVEMYEVYDGETLRGRFYLDLFPRPNKESWFYGVGLSPGKMTSEGYEVPVKMLLGNFARPTDELPSLISHSDLRILFHEFGHIMDGISYRGELAWQANSKADFVESMSQIFENWIWDYDMLSTFAIHYESGDTLPQEIFDKMLNAKNVNSGLSAIGSLRSSTYDMTIYDRFDPASPINTDDLWKQIDHEIGVMDGYIEGTHPQASWIHINTHPVYYYGYLWSDVYAQDMFTEFEKNGLLNQATGIRYRDIILANGLQRDPVEAVEEFLGRPSNNEAYIKSLGLD